MEPGENPGRIGHCECEALFMMSLASKDAEKAKSRDDAESGYLLCGLASERGLTNMFWNIRQNTNVFCADFCLKGICAEKTLKTRRELWIRNNRKYNYKIKSIGAARHIPFLPTENASHSPATQPAIRTDSIACFAFARFTPWARDAAEALRTQQAESRIAAAASFLTRKTITDISSTGSMKSLT